jgi:Flp pilus assembly protein TadG
MRRIPGRRSRGVVLITFAISMIVIMGMMGLAVDLGRSYIVRNEAQAFADAGALAGASSLDGTPAGATRAYHAVLGQYGATNQAWGRYQFDNNSFTSGTAALSVKFARNSTGPFVALSALATDATGYRFVEVIPTVQVPMYVSQVLTGRSTGTILARAVGAQIKKTWFDEGLAPFAPLAHCGGPGLPTCSTTGNLGFTDGDVVTMRWGSNAFSKLEASPPYPSTNKWCGDDTFSESPDFVSYLSNLSRAGAPGIVDGRGFIDMGTGPGVTALENLMWNGYLNVPFYVGKSDYSLLQKIAKSVGKELDDKAAMPWPDNMMLLPVVDPATGAILDFRAFELISTGSYFKGVQGNDPWCAIYRGGAQAGSGKESVLQDGIYEIRLVP